MLNKNLKITSEGVYQSTNYWFDIFGITALTLLIAYQLYLDKISLHIAAILIAALGGPPIYKRIKYGRKGVPLVELSTTELKIHLPNDSRSLVSLHLKSITLIQVYGNIKNRKYRFHFKEGNYQDVAPFYLSEQERKSVAEFISTRLPHHITVKSYEPQTMFAEVRGDDPPSE